MGEGGTNRCWRRPQDRHRATEVELSSGTRMEGTERGRTVCKKHNRQPRMYPVPHVCYGIGQCGALSHKHGYRGQLEAHSGPGHRVQGLAT